MKLPAKSTLWAAVALVAISNLHAGGSKLIAQEWMVHEFTEIMHLPSWMMYFIGVAQVLTGLLLLPDKARRQAAFANGLLCCWAVTSVIASGMGIFALVPLVSLLLSVFVYVKPSVARQENRPNNLQKHIQK
jgi:hypothetical protein